MSMLDALFMIGNYEDRKVDRTELDNGFIVDTVRVTDRDWEYETAVQHDQFNGGSWIIVAGYASYDEAAEGHNNWVENLKINGDYVTKLEDIFDKAIYDRDAD